MRSIGAGAAALCGTAFVAPTAQTKSLRATRAGEAPPAASRITARSLSIPKPNLYHPSVLASVPGMMNF